MRSRILKILFFLVILLVFFFTYIFFHNPQSIVTFQAYTSPFLKIDTKIVDDFFQEDIEIKQKAEKEIISTALTVINYSKWLEFVDYIDLNLYIEPVLPKETDQLIVALNLSKDLGVIVVFEKIDNAYIFHSVIENLVPINKIEFLSPSSHPYKMMLVYQTLDERFGAHFFEELLQVYLYLSNDFRNIWSKTLYYEEIYKEIWLNPQADENLWNRVVEDTVIDFLQEDPIKINTFTTMEKYTANSQEYPDLDKFTLVHTDNYQRSYYWSQEFLTFILGEVTKDVFLQNVALLEDMEDHREVLYGINNRSYKVITYNGEVIYLPKNKFQAMFQSFLEE